MYYTLDILSSIIKAFQVLSGIFDSIFSFVSNFVSLIANMFHSIITAVSIVNNSVQLPFDILSLVHPLLGACISLVVGVSVVKLVLGWGNA